MSPVWDFSSSQGFNPRLRSVDNDAPAGLRQELVDLIFHLVEQNPSVLDSERMHRVICQSLGERASGQPYGGFRYAAARDLARADWPRVYDLICRLWPDFVAAGVGAQYRDEVNRILSAYGVAWNLDSEGHLRRVLPSVVEGLVVEAIQELHDPRFAAALALFDAAKGAYDDIPRRDRDVCSNIFDAMESVAKEVFAMPTATFGTVLAEIRRRQALQPEVISVLEAVNTLRNRKFGHGMTVPFDLVSQETDFTYLTCIAGILLFARTVWQPGAVWSRHSLP